MDNSAGHRLKRTTGGVVTWYIYDGDTMIAQKSETGYTEYEIPGVGWVSPTGSGYSTTYTLTNQRGDTVGLAVGNQLTNIRDYDAYGGFYSLLANSDSDHRYVGGKGVIWNNASQTYTMGLREYSPYLGRFLNQDPIGYSGGLILYAYCGNEPVTRIDPSGRENEFISGWGDGLTFGLTKVIRAQIGLILGIGDANESINFDSGNYTAGEILGTVHSMAITGTGGMRVFVANASWLKLAENGVGHVVEKHVAMTLAKLGVRSLLDEGRFMSSFKSVRTAETVVRDVIEANERAISKWLASGTTRRLKISLSFPNSIGYGVGKDGLKYGLISASVVLKKAAGGAFDVLTAYPK